MKCAFPLRYVSGCLNLVVENGLVLMDGVWLPVSLCPGLAFGVRSLHKNHKTKRKDGSPRGYWGAGYRKSVHSCSIRHLQLIHPKFPRLLD